MPQRLKDLYTVEEGLREPDFNVRVVFLLQLYVLKDEVAENLRMALEGSEDALMKLLLSLLPSFSLFLRTFSTNVFFYNSLFKCFFVFPSG